MFAFLSGEIFTKSAGLLVLDVSGVGYLIHVSTGTLANIGAIGDDAFIFTHMNIRENDVSLYGFASEVERETFLKLLEVSGVGPKVALAALSTMTPMALATAIACDDVTAVSTIPGVGKKTAQRIIVDLKGKFDLSGGSGLSGSVGADSSSLGIVQDGGGSDAHAALLAMGFSSIEIVTALQGSDASAPTGEVVRYALQRLGG